MTGQGGGPGGLALPPPGGGLRAIRPMEDLPGLRPEGRAAPRPRATFPSISGSGLPPGPWVASTGRQARLVDRGGMAAREASARPAFSNG